MAAAEEAPEPLKYQTLALKVSIHCEGCKREVKRVLQHIDGVYKISVDSQQHKVVVTGNVTAESLIRKLTKSGKHAELWPKQKPIENAGGGGGGGKKKKKKNKNKNDGKPNEPPENTENNVTYSGDDSSAEASDKPDSEAPPLPEKQSGTEKAATDAGSGKKKGHKEHDSSSGGSGKPGGADPEVASQEGGQKAAGGSSLAIPPAIDAVSYSSVHPMPILMQQQSNCIYSTAPPGSYYFSEENANACCLM